MLETDEQFYGVDNKKALREFEKMGFKKLTCNFIQPAEILSLYVAFGVFELKAKDEVSASFRLEK
ncbi:hypothetical protein [Lactococcus fujiensis]|uniref:Uncharacterized protein n=1 Tax=Lactococcus fujiensis JCM 16395 TaxID=1291764 RepID=A0A2A5RI98_9LACT|nr:hypothetical protein [Lactococcus fujiensis]PCR98796.1 hypothetical protein RT41_GL000904 [Lactococcus fujiensis JCM 16395]